MPLGKASEKQIKTIEDEGERQIKAIQNEGEIKQLNHILMIMKILY